MSSSPQNMVDFIERHPGTFSVEKEILIAKQEFTSILENKKDSLIGRGHHESYYIYGPTEQVICILWDEDHDERVFIAIHKLMKKLVNDLAAYGDGAGQILMFGERKAHLSLVVATEGLRKYLEHCSPEEIEVAWDSWGISIFSPKTPNFACVMTNTDWNAYLENLLETRNHLAKVFKCLQIRSLMVAFEGIAVKDREAAKREKELDSLSRL